LHDSQSRETEKYSYESCETQNQEWLCWRGLAAIYLTWHRTAGLSCETGKYGSWVLWGLNSRMTVLARASSNLRDRQTDKTTVTC
jgi:hypothetical protein